MNLPRLTLWMVVLQLAAPTYAGMGEEDPLLAMLTLDRLERTSGGDERVWQWDANGWAGYDLSKLWVKSEGEYGDGRVIDGEVQILLSRAVTPYWDLQLGWRGEFKPEPNRDWLAISMVGVAPYWFEVDASVFVADRGRLQLRAEAEYEILFTQKVQLVPRIEVNWFRKDDSQRELGSGLASVEAGLRLRYQLRREFAPYVGVQFWKQYGRTADLAAAMGESADDVQLVVGVHAWW